MKIEQGLLITDVLPANSGIIFASEGVRLNGRELRFGKARRIKSNTNDHVLSVSRVTS
jgi:hypothetical protein